MAASFKDTADWTDIRLRSVNVGANHGIPFEGYQYVTVGELMIAQLLSKMGIPFTPDIALRVDIPEELRSGREGPTKVFVPDFVFNKEPLIWAGKHGPRLIHGIECKRSLKGLFPRRAVKYCNLLEQQKGIVIELMSEPEIRRYYDKGSLPVYPHKRKS